VRQANQSYAKCFKWIAIIFEAICYQNVEDYETHDHFNAGLLHADIGKIQFAKHYPEGQRCTPDQGFSGNKKANRIHFYLYGIYAEGAKRVISMLVLHIAGGTDDLLRRTAVFISDH